MYSRFESEDVASWAIYLLHSHFERVRMLLFAKLWCCIIAKVLGMTVSPAIKFASGSLHVVEELLDKVLDTVLTRCLARLRTLLARAFVGRAAGWGTDRRDYLPSQRLMRRCFIELACMLQEMQGRCYVNCCASCCTLCLLQRLLIRALETNDGD